MARDEPLGADLGGGQRLGTPFIRPIPSDSVKGCPHRHSTQGNPLHFNDLLGANTNFMLEQLADERLYSR
ncbi:MAG: hypothetical protein QOG25_1963, partial [Acetobacteraceae bacterium]|nr:hypothetical protein [Acetobacteraceae bacterium]